MGPAGFAAAPNPLSSLDRYHHGECALRIASHLKHEGFGSDLDLKGFIYAFVGAPVGPLFVLLYLRERDAAKGADKVKASPTHSGRQGPQTRALVATMKRQEPPHEQ
jgi:hypothetical protein